MRTNIFLCVICIVVAFAFAWWISCEVVSDIEAKDSIMRGHEHSWKRGVSQDKYKVWSGENPAQCPTYFSECRTCGEITTDPDTYYTAQAKDEWSSELKHDKLVYRQLGVTKNADGSISSHFGYVDAKTAKELELIHEQTVMQTIRSGAIDLNTGQRKCNLCFETFTDLKEHDRICKVGDDEVRRLRELSRDEVEKFLFHEQEVEIIE